MPPKLLTACKQLPDIKTVLLVLLSAVVCQASPPGLSLLKTSQGLMLAPGIQQPRTSSPALPSVLMSISFPMSHPHRIDFGPLRKIVIHLCKSALCPDLVVTLNTATIMMCGSLIPPCLSLEHLKKIPHLPRIAAWIKRN